MQPRTLAADDVLVYIHIPKTGGTSLIKILDAQFAPGEIFPVHSTREAEQRGGISLSPTRRYRFLRGHFRFGPFDDCIYRFVTQTPILITVMRDPIERTISSYRHILRRPENALHREFNERGITLSEYVTLPEYAPRVVNHQARQIAGSFTSSPRKWATREPATLEILRRLAIERFEQFAFVGLTEQLDQSVRIISWMFGFHITAEVPRLNPAPSQTSKESLSPAELEAVRAVNELDLELYELATRRFEVLWSAVQRTRDSR
jgi:hypothetical protein